MPSLCDDLWCMHNCTAFQRSQVKDSAMADVADLRPRTKRKWVCLQLSNNVTSFHSSDQVQLFCHRLLLSMEWEEARYQTDAKHGENSMVSKRNVGNGYEQINKTYLCWWAWGARQSFIPLGEVTGPLLCENTLELSKMIYSNDMRFSASKGWRWMFGKWHGIFELVEQDEQLSADRPAADSFIESFQKFIADEHGALSRWPNI